MSKEMVNNYSTDEINHIVSQIRIMQNGDPGISNIYEILESSTDYHIVEEYFKGGNLDKKRSNIGRNFNEINCAKVIVQILQVLCHLHENEIIHRNICPASIMFKSSNDDDFALKVSGYDFSTSFSHATIHENTSSLEYLAPELLSKNEVGDHKVDIWALGILAYSMIDGFTPFYDESGVDIEILSEDSKNQLKIDNIRRNIEE